MLLFSKLNLYIIWHRIKEHLQIPLNRRIVKQRHKYRIKNTKYIKDNYLKPSISNEDIYKINKEKNDEKKLCKRWEQEK